MEGIIGTNTLLMVFAAASPDWYCDWGNDVSGNLSLEGKFCFLMDAQLLFLKIPESSKNNCSIRSICPNIVLMENITTLVTEVSKMNFRILEPYPAAQRRFINLKKQNFSSIYTVTNPGFLR